MSHNPPNSANRVGSATIESPRLSEGYISGVDPRESAANNLFLCCLGFSRLRRVLGVLAAEALHAAGGIHQLLLAGEKWMAGGADFNADIALMCGAGNKGIAAGAVHADFAISGMNGCFHGGSDLDSNIRFYRNGRGFSNGKLSAMSAISYQLFTIQF